MVFGCWEKCNKHVKLPLTDEADLSIITVTSPGKSAKVGDHPIFLPKRM